MREVNEVIALTLAIIRTPFGQMIGAHPHLGTEAGPDPA